MPGGYDREGPRPARSDPYRSDRRSRSPADRYREIASERSRGHADGGSSSSRWRDAECSRSGKAEHDSYRASNGARDREERSGDRSDRYSRPSHSRRSRSPPDFERDRARERAAYETTAGISRDAEAKEAAEKPNFEQSGLLAAASNNINGVALKYHEPPEARKPKKQWRLYVFKDGKEIDLLHVSRQSCYLFGRDRTVVDVPVEHPSCSKQHAVLQHRLIVERNEFGDEKRLIKPFLIDLDSSNGCAVNDQDIPPSRYYELKSGDTITFGASTREYVLLAED